jgi:hypothetical protein
MPGTTCAIYGCGNGYYKLQRWAKLHDCSIRPKPFTCLGKGPCKKPFDLFNFL